MVRKCFAALALTASFAAPALAQDSGELILYSKGRYEGYSIVVTAPRQNIPEFTAKSVQIPEGTDWELCSGNRFTGCRRFSHSVPAFVITVRSARPVGSVVTGPGGTPVAAPTTPIPGGPTLRGMAAEFFTAPERGGTRIEVTAGEAAKEANDFCRSLGWRSAAHQDVQPASGRTFLADVLCVQK